MSQPTPTIIELYTPDDDPEIGQHLNAAIKFSLLHNKAKNATPAERQTEIQRAQDTIGAMKMQYSDDSLEFAALRCAYEALRLAWRAVGSDVDGAWEKLQLLDGAVEGATAWMLATDNDPAWTVATDGLQDYSEAA